MAHVSKIPDYSKNDPLFKKADHAPKTDMRLRTGGKDALGCSEPIVNCLLYRRRDGSYYVKVQLRSHVKPDRLLEAPVELAGLTEKESAFNVAVVCGAMAERLDESYGDDFTPERAAKAGEDAFYSVLRAYEKNSVTK